MKDYICAARQRRREMFVPLSHPPGHAQVDFGEALAVIGGVEAKIHFLSTSLPHSDACFVKAYPGETTSAKNRSFPRVLEPTQAATHKSTPKQVLH